MTTAAVLCAAITLIIYACINEARRQQDADNLTRITRHYEAERAARINAELDLADARLRLALKNRQTSR